MKSERRGTSDRSPEDRGPLSVTILIPARDEAASLPGLLSALREADPGPGVLLERVLVVDNGSSDGTAAVARAGGAEVVEEPRPGYGRACLRGIEALTSGRRPAPDVLVFLDADDHRAPEQLPALLEAIRRRRADLVVGERRSPRGRGVRWHASVGNRLVCWVLRGLYGSPVRDLGPFRAVRWSCLRDLELDDPDYGWYVQMQVRALRAGYRVTGVPVRFRRRAAGRSKVSGSLAGSAAAARAILRTLAIEILRTPPGRRPLEPDRE